MPSPDQASFRNSDAVVEDDMLSPRAAAVLQVIIAERLSKLIKNSLIPPLIRQRPSQFRYRVSILLASDHPTLSTAAQQPSMEIVAPHDLTIGSRARNQIIQICCINGESYSHRFLTSERVRREMGAVLTRILNEEGWMVMETEVLGTSASPGMNPIMTAPRIKAIVPQTSITQKIKDTWRRLMPVKLQKKTRSRAQDSFPGTPYSQRIKRLSWSPDHRSAPKAGQIRAVIKLETVTFRYQVNVHERETATGEVPVVMFELGV